MKIVHRYSYVALLLPLHVGVSAGIGDHESRLDEDRVFLTTEELIEHENKELRNSQNKADPGRSLLRMRNIRKAPADSPQTQDICSLPKEVGPCKALLPRFYYNKKKEQCEEFNYGGCFGNGNNFNTFAKCQKACDNGDDDEKNNRNKCCDPRKEPGYDGNPICTEGHACCQETGEWTCSIGDAKTFPCNGKLTTGPFGEACGELSKLSCCDRKERPYCLIGNAECCPEGKWACPNGDTNIFLCGKPPVRTSGPLLGKQCPRDVDEGKRCPKKRPNPNDACDSQIVGEERCCYGKETCCGKTNDSFCCHCFSYNHWACYHTDACFAPCPCSDDVKKCPDGSFVGRDRFNDCKFSECPPFDVDDICSLPPTIGPCEAAFTRYYYNRKTGQCEEFTYGGCGGNENNFENMQQCQRACYDD